MLEKKFKKNEVAVLRDMLDAELIDHSYEMVVKSMPKKKQAELENF